MTGPDSGAGPRYEACLSALKAWRDALVREGKLPLGGIKDTDLHRAISRGRRDERQVSNVLPATYRRFAADMVEVIHSTDIAAVRAGMARDTPPPAAVPRTSAPPTTPSSAVPPTPVARPAATSAPTAPASTPTTPAPTPRATRG